ncbi:MAG TPA: flagellar biosynthesis protein FlgA [Micromonosporaceae bacterium]|nr:flagellar biosynthesis protein FlgA [Micromonosporaceae bacterium]
MASEGWTVRPQAGQPPGREPTLRAARWPGPSRGTLLRAGLVAALLALAAGVLYSGEPAVPCPDGPPKAAGLPAASEAAAGGTGTGNDDVRSAPLALPSGLVGVPVRLAEPASLAVVRPGSRVDLLAVVARDTEGGPQLVASRALVLDVVGMEATDGYPALYLALQPDQAHRTVGMPEHTRFTIIVR